MGGARSEGGGGRLAWGPRPTSPSAPARERERERVPSCDSECTRVLKDCNQIVSRVSTSVLEVKKQLPRQPRPSATPDGVKTPPCLSSSRERMQQEAAHVLKSNEDNT